MSIVICQFNAVHRFGGYLWVLFVFVSTSFQVSGQDGNVDSGQPKDSIATQRNDESESVSLLHDYDEAVEQAGRLDRPIIVILGAEWCGPCKQLEKDLELPVAASIFKQWIVVKVDIDEEPTLAKEWQVNAVPAFRILGVDQEVTASNEGFGGLKKLQSWLLENFDAANPRSQRLLRDDKPVDAKIVSELIAMLRDRRPANRKLTSARLARNQDLAAGPVLAVLASGSLSQKIGALEILEKWTAPIAGIDPWEPDTISVERLAVLQNWLRSYQNRQTK
jgi:thioredoxin-like negative regulator of GroEL